MYFPSEGWSCVSSWVATGSWPSRAACSTVSVIGAPGSSDEVDDGEDDDPHHVHEVPVEAGDLHGLGPLAGERAPGRHHEEAHQHDDPDGDVDAVEAGQDEEGR